MAVKEGLSLNNYEFGFKDKEKLLETIEEY